MSFELIGHTKSVTCLDVDARNNRLVSGSEDRTARVWDLRTRRCARLLSVPESALGSPRQEDADIGAVRFLPHGVCQDQIILAYGNALMLYDLRKEAVVLKEAQLLRDRGDDVVGAAPGAGGGGLDEVLGGPLPVCSEDVNSIDVSQDGGSIVACDDSGDAVVVNLSSLRTEQRFTGGHTNICSSARFRPGRNQHVITGGLDSSVRCWDVSNGQSFAQFGTSLADIQACLPWQVETSVPVHINPPFVHDVDVHCGGDLALVALGDGNVALFDVALRSAVDILCEAHRGLVAQAKFIQVALEANVLVATAGSDQLVRLWKLDPESPYLQARVDASSSIAEHGDATMTAAEKAKAKKRRQKKLQKQRQKQRQKQGTATSAPTPAPAHSIVWSATLPEKPNQIVSGASLETPCIVACDTSARVKVRLLEE